MSDSALGILLACGCALCWAASALCFEAAGKRVGSLPTNLLRLAMALALLFAYLLVVRGTAWPQSLNAKQWNWLAWSGVVGFFLCDWPLFRAYLLVGARVAALVMTLAPAFAAAGAWWFLDERLNAYQLAGVATTVAGVALVVTDRRHHAPARPSAMPPDAPDDVPPRHDYALGLVLSFVAAVLQGAASVMIDAAGKSGGRVDPFEQTFARVLAGVPCFVLLVALARRTTATLTAARDKRAMTLMLGGAVAGPFLGVTLLIAAINRAGPGPAQAVAATSPVVLLPLSMLSGERPGPRAWLGAAVAVGGVMLLTLAAK